MIKSILISISLLLSTPAYAGFDLYSVSRYDNAPHTVRYAGRHLNPTYSHRHANYTHSVNSVVVHRTRGDGRPKAWCGWYMRQIKGGGPSFNKASNWTSFGRKSAPGLGVVVVWPHHVGYIVGRNDKGWIVRSGNWNNRVADVPLSRMPKNILAFRS